MEQTDYGEVIRDGERLGRLLRESAGTGLPAPVELAAQIIGRQHAQFQRIAELACEGAQTDGAHHKQWYLAQIAAELGIVLADHGIAP
jgi:hypothetical protein